MIKNKKVMMALSFTLGATLLVSTAFADIVSMSGYEQLKQAIKYTSKSCSKNLESFTTQFSVTLKDNERVLFTSSQTDKFDNALGSAEHKSSSEYYNGSKDTNDSYSDKKCNIWYNSWNDTYQVFEYSKERENTQFSDPFEEDEMNDIEKIIDAGVGNLKDYVIVDEKPDGSKEFSGSLNDAQIPALVNAISSFGFKRTIPDMDVGIGNSFPKIQTDVFIKKITGKATVNKDGLLERIYGFGIISGKDTDGISHDLTLEVLVRFYDINSTVVNKPDLTGKKVEKQFENNSVDTSISQKYIGQYKQNIVIEENNSFIKIGERTVVIEHIDDKNVSGKYFETYGAQYAQYAKDKQEFDFDAEIKDYNNASFELINDKGNKQIVSINFDGSTGGIYFYMELQQQNSSRSLFDDSTFLRVFEN